MFSLLINAVILSLNCLVLIRAVTGAEKRHRVLALLTTGPNSSNREI